MGKFSISGLLRLKPFNEDDDAKLAGGVYASSFLLNVGIVLCCLCAIAAVPLVIADSPLAKTSLLISCALSCLIAGAEWHLGLKGRALNQLTWAALAVIVIALLP